LKYFSNSILGILNRFLRLKLFPKKAERAKNNNVKDTLITNRGRRTINDTSKSRNRLEKILKTRTSKLCILASTRSRRRSAFDRMST
ncbi:MAG: hypothetical protein JXK07_02115, partial [Spirochaetes bacterium]|nr:hypothetical protein [Spirochaetota bacterium]MBN2771848.1 hypothetical protein [Spirochaetota bacterium]